ncbi:aminoacyl tRNA synthase complex-interacting multifunctional protein 1 isoform X1 [Phoenix dactylifera]|uniref:Aminoacyl tRNA synthase complex-interacting multifunctional protein 1 isoform X1 n=1 Tax=Phoenix dactylifera TaxID=42345 RepID=A0A8B7C5P6_PHODC|nr:aminoacyl tRNA synthase complex-interacting multifunctional protein 1 isoform X1 [Phoenix dactylifera]
MTAAMESKGSGGVDIASNRNKAILHALSKRLSFDRKKFPSESIGGYDIMSLISNILQLSASGVPLQNPDEIMKWVTFASDFPSEADACHATLKGLNEDLAQRAVLLGDGLKPSVADIVVFSTLHHFVSQLTASDMQKFSNVMRWMDYIQNKEDFGGEHKMIVINKPVFEPLCSKKADKTDADLTSKKVTQGPKNVDKPEGNIDPKKGAAEKKASGDDKAAETSTKNNKPTEEKKKASEKASAEKETECSITILNIQVGVIRKAWKHPSADSLLVEEIDLGDGNLRQVVSGLAKFCSPDDLLNRRVVLITNVKPGKLRDVMSAGLVLCASNQDHTVVEPLIPPEGAKLGECVSFSGYEGKPEDILNPKKKQLEKITPHLYTDDKGVATYKGTPFMTSAGPCASSISNASIK